MSNWRQSPVMALTLIAVFLVVQLSIPISRMGDIGSAPRFAWQMFSSSVPAQHFVVETSAGDIEIDLDDYMVRKRADIDLRAHLPPYLCLVLPGAEAVIWDGGELEC